MRALREALAAAGVRQCSICGFSTEVLHGASATGGGINFGFGDQWLNPLDWMDVERQPALVQHGSPEAPRTRAYITATCRRCFATTFFDRGWYSADHPDLTQLSDEEQVRRDGK